MEVTMTWTETTRRQYRRDGLDYASSMTDKEWALMEPFMPAPKLVGRPRKTELRAVIDAILYILATGCQLAGIAEKLSAALDRSGLLLQMARRRHMALHQSDAGPTQP